LYVLKLGNSSELTELNLKNNNNQNFSTVCNYENMPILNNVCVDDLNNTTFTNFITTEVGHSINFTDNCSVLSISSNEISSLLIFPNPVNDLLYIETPNKVKIIEFYNEIGQLTYSDKNSTIDISNFNKGMYFVKIVDINGSISIKKILVK